MAGRRKSSGKKRTLSPEQLEKMKAGRERKKKHDERMQGLSDLEQRLRKAASGR